MEIPGKLLDDLHSSLLELHDAIDPTWSLAAWETASGLASQIEHLASPVAPKDLARMVLAIRKLSERVDQLLDEPLIHPVSRHDSPYDDRYFALSRLMRVRYALDIVEATMRLQV